MKKNYTIRLESTSIDKLKKIAESKTVKSMKCSYTSIIQELIDDRIEQERRKNAIANASKNKK